MPASKFNSVEDYVASLDPIKGKTVQAVVDFLLAEFPELKAKISWNVPQLHRKGQYVAGIAAFKKHLTFAPWSAKVIADFQPRLTGYEIKQNCFQIPVDWQIDRQLLIDLVAARLAELD